MSFCSRSLKIGIFAQGSLVKVRETILSGPLGEIYNQLFFDRRHGNCTVRILPPLADRSITPQERNFTWNSRWQTKMVDMILWDGPLREAHDIVEATNVVGRVTLQAGQYLKPHSKNLDLFSLLVDNFWLLAFTVLGYLLIAATTAILPKLTHANRSSTLKSLKLLLFRALFMDHNRWLRVHLRLMFLFFNLFLFFDFNFIGGQTRTEKVTVPTDEIVDSASKLLSTSKTLIIDGFWTGYFGSAPKESLLKGISRKKLFKVHSFSDLRRVKRVDDYVFLIKDIGLAASMALLAEPAKRLGSVAFIKAASYFEIVTAFQMRRSLDEERKRFINSRAEASFEHGLQLSFAIRSTELYKSQIKQVVEVYETLEDFVGEISRKASPNVKVANIQNLFLFFGSFLMVVSLGFLVDILLLKHLQISWRKLARLLIRSAVLARKYPFGESPFSIVAPNLNPVTSTKPVNLE